MRLGTIAYNFGRLFNDGKKIACLQNGLKFAALRKILFVIMMSFYKNVGSSKRLTVVVVFA